MSSLRTNIDPRWPGLLHNISYIYGFTLITSLIVLIMSCILQRQLSDAVDKMEMRYIDYKTSGYAPSTAEITFYEATTPFVSILQCVIIILFHHFQAVKPLYSFINSTFSLAGWSITMAFWGNCDVGYWGDNNFGFCEHWPTIAGREGTTAPLQWIRIAFASLVIAGYFGAMVFSAVAVHRGRLGRGNKDVEALKENK